MVPEYARFLKERGVTGVFVAGSTGEGVSCTVAERNLLYAAWAQAARPLGLRAIAMVGALAFEDIKALIGGAEAAAVDAVAVLPPQYFRPADAQALADWVRLVCAQTSLKVFLYHIPSISKVGASLDGDFGMAALAPLVADIDNFVGFKYTYEDFYDLSQVAGFEDAASGGRRFEVFFGRDEMMTAGLAAPIDGFVGSTYNFASPIYAALLRAHETGDDAEASVLMADAQVRKDAVHKEARHAGKAKYAQPSSMRMFVAISIADSSVSISHDAYNIAPYRCVP